jgi:probable rRNA maturation factor
MSTIEPVPLIDVIVEAPQWDTASAAEATVRRALSEAAIATGADFKDRVLAVLLTDDAAIRRLNAQWRGIDKPTNVLSFPPAPNPGKQMRAVTSLGDIAIAYETTAHEAEVEEKPFDHHLAHLAVHGFLHLLGYGHDTEAAATTM